MCAALTITRFGASFVMPGVYLPIAPTVRLPEDMREECVCRAALVLGL